jgi:hypothetical protein
VYSFGILLWEITMRATPWQADLVTVSSEGDPQDFLFINNALQQGRRPTLSVEVVTNHPAFVDIMRRCWSSDPADRPSFESVLPQLAACLRATSAYDID